MDKANGRKLSLWADGSRPRGHELKPLSKRYKRVERGMDGGLSDIILLCRVAIIRNSLPIGVMERDLVRLGFQKGIGLMLEGKIIYMSERKEWRNGSDGIPLTATTMGWMASICAEANYWFYHFLRYYLTVIKNNQITNERKVAVHMEICDYKGATLMTGNCCIPTGHRGRGWRGINQLEEKLSSLIMGDLNYPDIKWKWQPAFSKGTIQGLVVRCLWKDLTVKGSGSRLRVWGNIET